MSVGGTVDAGEIRVLDIGVIGLTSHDLLSFDRETRSYRQNERLDLSTIFDFEGGSRFRQGGDYKNSENPAVYTIVQHLLMIYQTRAGALLREGKSAETAHDGGRRAAVAAYLEMIPDSFQRLFGIPFPTEPLKGEITDEEQAAMRAAHHILPGKISLDRPVCPITGKGERTEIELTNPQYATTLLSMVDLLQSVTGFKEKKGEYDAQYRAIYVPSGPRQGVMDLFEVDRAFVESNTSFKFQELIGELTNSDGFKGTRLQPFIESLYRKGLNPDGNPWITK